MKNLTGKGEISSKHYCFLQVINGLCLFCNSRSVWIGIKRFTLDGKFSVRKCVVGQKEKIMIASYEETSGFSAVGAEELMLDRLSVFLNRSLWKFTP
jgi:hypothetical protein